VGPKEVFEANKSGRAAREEITKTAHTLFYRPGFHDQVARNLFANQLRRPRNSGRGIGDSIVHGKLQILRRAGRNRYRAR